VDYRLPSGVPPGRPAGRPGGTAGSNRTPASRRRRRNWAHIRP